MTAREFVRNYFPSASDAEAHAILWECTAWPAAGLELAGHQLGELAIKANDTAQALYISYGEADVAWAEHMATFGVQA